MTLYIELERGLENQFREKAMKQFGYSKGALKEAVQEAVELWLTLRPLLEITPAPLSTLRGLLKSVKIDSVTLKHNAAGLFAK